MFRIATICACVFTLLIPSLIEAKPFSFDRDEITVEPKDPRRFKAKDESDVGKMVRQGSKGKRGAKRSPRAFKKITAKRLIQAADEALKSGARGARGAKIKAARDRLKAGTFTFELEEADWVGPNRGKKGARGRSLVKRSKKTLSQKQVLAELNSLERRANKQGYSLLDNPSKDEEFESNFDQGASDLKAQYAKDAKNLKSEKISKAPLQFRKQPLFAKVKFKSGARGAKKSALRMVTGAAEFKVGPPSKKSSRGARGKKSPAPPPKRVLKTYRGRKIDKSKTFGKKKLAAVSLIHTFERSASQNELNVKSKTGFSGWVFGKSVMKTQVKVDVTARTSGRLSGGITAKWFGKDVKAPLTLKKTVASGEVYTKSDRWSKSGQKSKKIRFFLGPIPCSVEVGAAFKAGIEYRAAFSRAAISLDITPFVNADAFARFAIDIGIAAAGIEGRVTLLDAEMRTSGELGLSTNEEGQLIVYDVFQGDRGRKSLAGKLYVFARINLLFVKKTYKHKIFKWGGKKDVDRLYRINTEVRLVSTKALSKDILTQLVPVKTNREKYDGHFGKWRDPGVCPKGSFAFAAAQKILPKQGKKRDDLGLTGLMIRCRTPGGVETKTIWSSNLTVGTWSEWAKCPDGEAFVGYRFKLQKKQGKKKDDSAVNEIEFVCGDGTKINPVVKGAGRWGKWRSGQRCKQGGRIDKFRLKLQTGKKKDHTGVNSIEVWCRKYRKLKKGATPSLKCSQGKLEGSRCRLADANLSGFGSKCSMHGNKCGCGLYIGKKHKEVFVRCFGGRYGPVKSGGKAPPPPPPGKKVKKAKSAPKAPPKIRTCPKGWYATTATLQLKSKKKKKTKKKKRDVCLLKVKGVSRSAANACVSAEYYRESGDAYSEFARLKECNIWIDSRRNGVFTFPTEQ